MQPNEPLERPAGMLRPSPARAALALLLALGALAAPTASVLACSCASLADTPAGYARSAAANGGVAFLGTVVATRPAPPDPNGFGEVVIYAFDVERSTAAVPGTLEVRALNDPGGAACGFVFGMDEEWFVTAYPEGGGALSTSLCSNNRLAVELGEADMRGLVQALAVVPAPDGEGAEPAFDPGAWVPIGVGLFAVLLVGALMVVAFRGPRQPTPG